MSQRLSAIRFVHQLCDLPTHPRRRAAAVREGTWRTQVHHLTKLPTEYSPSC